MALTKTTEVKNFALNVGNKGELFRLTAMVEEVFADSTSGREVAGSQFFYYRPGEGADVVAEGDGSRRMPAAVTAHLQAVLDWISADAACSRTVAETVAASALIP